MTAEEEVEVLKDFIARCIPFIGYCAYVPEIKIKAEMLVPDWIDRSNRMHNT